MMKEIERQAPQVERSSYSRNRINMVKRVMGHLKNDICAKRVRSLWKGGQYDGDMDLRR